MYILAKTVDTLLSIYIWMILIRAILSWVPSYSRVPIAGFLYRLTDPFLEKVRQLLPLPRMAIDISPVIAILVLMLIRYMVVAFLG